MIRLERSLEELQKKLETTSFSTVTGETAPESKRDRPHLDPSFPNLLTDDPFYEETLAEILPEDFQPEGIRQTSTNGRPKNLHPFNGWADNSTWYGLCVPTLSNQHVGIFETMAPSLAIKIEERTSKEGVPEFWVHLREGVFWAPFKQSFFEDSIELAPHFLKKHPVTAEDVKFYWQAMMNPHLDQPGAVARRNYFGDIEEIEVIDDLTLVVRWKAEEDGDGKKRIKYVARYLTGWLKPLPSFVYKYFPDGTKIVDEVEPNTYLTNSVWAQNFSQHWAKNVIASIGPYLFEAKTDQGIQFKRNGNFFDQKRALVEGIEVVFRDSPDAIWQDFKVGRGDQYSLRPNELIEWEDFQESEDYLEQVDDGDGIDRLDYVARSCAYLGWNAKRPFFEEKELRQAMTMAIDRQRIIDDILNGMGEEITGTFFLRSPSYDTSIEPWPFDPEGAKRLLEAAGWIDHDGDGIRDKEIDGVVVPFRFELTYFVKNPTTAAIASYIAEAMKGIGVVCQLKGVDVADLSAAIDEKNFDGIVMGWTLGTPPEEPKQLWHSEGADIKGSSNLVGFANNEADRIIEDLQYTYNPAERRRLYHRFHAILHEEAPYTFLYTPKVALLYREWLKNVFLPADRQDLIPGANVEAPQAQLFYLDKS